MTFLLEKGLTREQALFQVRKLKQRWKLALDFRGFVYNPKTGKAVVT